MAGSAAYNCSAGFVRSRTPARRRCPAAISPGLWSTPTQPGGCIATNAGTLDKELGCGCAPGEGASRTSAIPSRSPAATSSRRSPISRRRRPTSSALPATHNSRGMFSRSRACSAPTGARSMTPISMSAIPPGTPMCIAGWASAGDGLLSPPRPVVHARSPISTSASRIPDRPGC